MYLGLVNASIRKLLRLLLKCSIAYVYNNTSSTFRGHLKHILEHIYKILQLSDKCYTRLYHCMKTQNQPLPMRFDVPSTESLISSLNLDDSYEFFLKCIKFVKQSNRYLCLHDESVRLSLKHQEVFKKLEYTMVKFSDAFLLGHILNLLSPKCQKEWLHSILTKEHEMVIDMFYIPTAKTSGDIYTRTKTLCI
jgi:hypothetical protein